MNDVLNSLIEVICRVLIASSVMFTFAQLPEINKPIPAILVFVLFLIWAFKGVVEYIRFYPEEIQ